MPNKKTLGFFIKKCYDLYKKLMESIFGEHNEGSKNQRR